MTKFRSLATQAAFAPSLFVLLMVWSTISAHAQAPSQYAAPPGYYGVAPRVYQPNYASYQPTQRRGYAPAAQSANYPQETPAEFEGMQLSGWYGVDPAIVDAATLGMVPPAQANPYGAAPAHYQTLPAGFSIAAPGMQQYGQGGYANPYQQASYAGPPGAYQDPLGPPVDQNQPMPTFSYSANTVDDGNVTFYGQPDPANMSGGVQFSPGVPPWMKGFSTGVYANDDQVVFSLGGTISLWETNRGAIATRWMATAGALTNGPTRAGYSGDIWWAQHVRAMGANHLAKIGFFYDNQNPFNRYGIATGGILFADNSHIAPTFDIAIGLGDGAETQLGGRYLQAANEDVQMRFGVVINQRLRFGVTGQYWHWDDPRLRDEIWTGGAYAQMNIGQWLVSIDGSASDDQVQGFINLLWQPGQGHPHRGLPSSVSMASSDWQGRYKSWMTQPVIRDIAIRTGDEPSRRKSARRLIGNLSDVRCFVRFPPDDFNGVPMPAGADANLNGIIDPGDDFEIVVVVSNNTGFTAQDVRVQGVGGSGMPVVFGPAMQAGAAAFGAMFGGVAPGQSRQTSATEDIDLTVNGAAMAGEQIFIEFEVQADGECARFRCGPITVGQSTNGDGGPATLIAPCPPQP